MLMRGSSSTMVPTPWLSTIDPLVGALRLTTQFSDGSAGLADGNRQRAGSRLVVAAGRGASVGGGVVDRHGLAARGRKADREHEGGRAAVAFQNCYVTDEQRRDPRPVEGIRPGDVGVVVRDVVDGVGLGEGVQVGEGRGGGRDVEAAAPPLAGQTIGSAVDKDARAAAPAVRRIAGE